MQRRAPARATIDPGSRPPVRWRDQGHRGRRCAQGVSRVAEGTLTTCAAMPARRIRSRFCLDALRCVIPVAVKKSPSQTSETPDRCTTPSKSGSASMASQESDRWYRRDSAFAPAFPKPNNGKVIADISSRLVIINRFNAEDRLPSLGQQANIVDLAPVLSMRLRCLTRRATVASSPASVCRHPSLRAAGIHGGFNLGPSQSQFQCAWPVECWGTLQLEWEGAPSVQLPKISHPGLQPVHKLLLC